MTRSQDRNGGTVAALLTPLLMGMAPIFGKLAIRSGIDPYTLASLRTLGAAGLLWIVYGLFFRRFIYIFPAGLLATLAVGLVNGLGSLLYYNGLLLLDDASLRQRLVRLRRPRRALEQRRPGRPAAPGQGQRLRGRGSSRA